MKVLITGGAGFIGSMLADKLLARGDAVLVIDSHKDPSNWAEDSRTNVVGTALVVQAAERSQVRRFIYFQTALC